MSELVWATVICPICQREIAVHLVALAATCKCGAYYADVPGRHGWYRSREAYERGEAPIR